MGLLWIKETDNYTLGGSLAHRRHLVSVDFDDESGKSPPAMPVLTPALLAAPLSFSLPVPCFSCAVFPGHLGLTVPFLDHQYEEMKVADAVRREDPDRSPSCFARVKFPGSVLALPEFTSPIQQRGGDGEWEWEDLATHRCAHMYTDMCIYTDEQMHTHEHSHAFTCTQTHRNTN